MIREQMSQQLQLPLEVMNKIARSASRRYKMYTVPKRTKGVRVIYHPAKELKALQRWLLYAVIQKWLVHTAAHGYEKGRNTRSTAIGHAKNKYLLRMDFTDFFPSMTSQDIQEYIIENPESVSNWSQEDIEFFIRIVCRNGCLTIGAPTSPRLSNVLCRHFDALVADLCDADGVKYTRYADDMFFSTTRPNVLCRIESGILDIVNELECPANLQVNSAKTHHSSKKGRRVITGLILTQDGEVSIGRAQKRYLRSLIHRYRDLDEKERAKLAGHLAYFRSVEPNYINRLVLKFGPNKVHDAMMPPNTGEGRVGG